MKCECSGGFSRDPPVLGRGSRYGSCFLRFLGAFRDLEGNGVRWNLA